MLTAPVHSQVGTLSCIYAQTIHAHCINPLPSRHTGNNFQGSSRPLCAERHTCSSEALDPAGASSSATSEALIARPTSRGENGSYSETTVTSARSRTRGDAESSALTVAAVFSGVRSRGALAGWPCAERTAHSQACSLAVRASEAPRDVPPAAGRSTGSGACSVQHV